MKSRLVHRVRRAKHQANTTVETYQASSRGLTRVFAHILPGEDARAGTAAARAAHHLAEVEALLPRLREAIRSCRYPGAEHGDPAALVWGLWSHLSETLLHVKGALQSLEVLGQRYRYRNEEAAAADLHAAALVIRGPMVPKRRAKTARPGKVHGAKRKRKPARGK